MFSCDFVQAPPTGDPNHGSLLATATKSTANAAIKAAATQAAQYAKPGRIHAMVYSNGGNISYTGETVEAVKNHLLS